ncbi:hypothetical protein JTE90_002155 [Oedothorax gibbosus]|uniref:Salivary lipocalin n=1 Tax=Oedothorax gibbosus TaxID=931172 RepID=A0AAV6V8S7_9ARAC|nr:hypothetical protein JTE90_002155 [Oedothorax gibbosus]
MLPYALLASLLACCCLAVNNPTVEPPMNETMSNTTTSESNMTIPILIIVEEANKMKTRYDTDADYSVRDVNWIVVKRITNITSTKESSVDPKTKKTMDILTENRAEDLHADAQSQVRFIGLKDYHSYIFSSERIFKIHPGQF